MRQVSLILGAIVVLGLTWCATSAPPLCVRSMAYDPVPLNESVQLHAGGVDILYECDLPYDIPVRWNSNDTSVATVDEHGLATLRAEGTVRIWAQSRRMWQGRDSAFHELKVIPAVESVRLQPRDTVVSRMDTVKYSARAIGRESVVLDVSPSIIARQDRFSELVRERQLGRLHFRRLETKSGLDVWSQAPASGWVVARIGGHRDSVRLTVR